MSKATENLMNAQQHAIKIRPKMAGFPYLAETLRAAGVTKNLYYLPSCQSIFLTEEGPVVMQGTPLVYGSVDIPPFDKEALIRAIKADQAGETSFPEFLTASWKAGIVNYEVDFIKRTVSYYGCLGEKYIENYPAIELSNGEAHS